MAWPNGWKAGKSNHGKGKLKDFQGNSPLRTGIFGNSSTLSRPNTRLPSNGLRVTLPIQTTTDATNWRPRQLGHRFQPGLNRWATAWPGRGTNWVTDNRRYGGYFICPSLVGVRSVYPP